MVLSLKEQTGKRAAARKAWSPGKLMGSRPMRVVL